MSVHDSKEARKSAKVLKNDRVEVILTSPEVETTVDGEDIPLQVLFEVRPAHI